LFAAPVVLRPAWRPFGRPLSSLRPV